MNKNAAHPPEDEAGEKLSAFMSSATLKDALAIVTAEPATDCIDKLAMRDLLWLEHSVPRNSENEHASKVHEFCALARAAKTPMKAGYFLRRAMAFSKDFMLWEDSQRWDEYRVSQSARRRGTGLLDDRKKAAILNQYRQRVLDGQRYGAIRDLAAQHGISETTVKTIVKAPK